MHLHRPARENREEAWRGGLERRLRENSWKESWRVWKSFLEAGLDVALIRFSHNSAPCVPAERCLEWTRKSRLPMAFAVPSSKVYRWKSICFCEQLSFWRNLAGIYFSTLRLLSVSGNSVVLGRLKEPFAAFMHSGRGTLAHSGRLSTLLPCKGWAFRSSRMRARNIRERL